MVPNWAPENLEIPGLVLAHHPGMTRRWLRQLGQATLNGLESVKKNHQVAATWTGWRAWRPARPLGATFSTSHRVRAFGSSEANRTWIFLGFTV